MKIVVRNIVIKEWDLLLKTEDCRLDPTTTTCFYWEDAFGKRGIAGTAAIERCGGKYRIHVYGNAITEIKGDENMDEMISVGDNFYQKMSEHVHVCVDMPTKLKWEMETDQDDRDQWTAENDPNSHPEEMEPFYHYFTIRFPTDENNKTGLKLIQGTLPVPEPSMECEFMKVLEKAASDHNAALDE